MKLVSVIIPAYNQAQYLGDAIESVLNQTYKNWECLIIDDGSKDHTFKVAARYSDRRIIYIRQKNQGLSAARNTGIRLSKGEYLSFLDSDDLFDPQKLSTLVEIMEKDPQMALAAGNAGLIDEHGNPISRQFPSQLPENAADLLLGNPLHVGSVLVRKTWQEKTGLFNDSLRSYEDWDYWLRIGLAGGKMISIPQVVSYYRFHTQQMIRNPEQMTTASFAVLKNFFQRPELPKEWTKRRDFAYSHAHIRAAANAYLSGSYTAAGKHLNDATRLNPSLLEKNGKKLLDKIVAWTELPKVKEPLEFLEQVFDNLPSSLNSINVTKRKVISRAVINHAFAAYHAGDLDQSFFYLKQGLRFRPVWLGNRGVLSILRHAILQQVKFTWQKWNPTIKEDHLPPAV